jgi:hypothetical protein
LSGFQLKLISTRHEFNSNNFIFTALNLLMRRLSFKTQFKIELLGPFYGPKLSYIFPPEFLVVFNRFQCKKSQIFDEKF